MSDATTPQTLPYPPPGQSTKVPFIVLAAGLSTTTLALFGSWAINKYGGENIMGWYADYVIPVGALLIGLVASCGYGIASWVSGVKIRGGLLALILSLQVFAYFSAHYIEFRSQGPLVHRDTGAPVTFPEYFHFSTTSLAWKSEKHDTYRLPG